MVIKIANLNFKNILGMEDMYIVCEGKGREMMKPGKY